MALELKYTVTENPDRLGINISEQTGSYSSGNLGGYGSPNPALGDVVSAVFTIQKRGDTAIYSIDPSPELPTSDSTIQLLVPATSFGYAANEKIEDGIYKVTYTVNYVDSLGNQASDFDSFYFAFTEKLKCCIRNIRSATPVPTDGCNCSEEKINALASADQLLTSICELVKCDKLDRAQAVIDYLKRYCECNCTECD